MVVSGYYRVYCVFRGCMKTEADDIDFNEFDTKINEVERQVQKQESHRDIRLETTHFNEGYAELLFVFKGSYLERTSELEQVMDNVAEEIESSMDFTVDEKEIEAIV